VGQWVLLQPNSKQSLNWTWLLVTERDRLAQRYKYELGLPYDPAQAKFVKEHWTPRLILYSIRGLKTKELIGSKRMQDLLVLRSSLIGTALSENELR
jgi:hypothetical protein